MAVSFMNLEKLLLLLTSLKGGVILIFRKDFFAELPINCFFLMAVTSWLAGIVGFSIKEALDGPAPETI
jgi:hypothetical protein